MARSGSKRREVKRLRRELGKLKERLSRLEIYAVNHGHVIDMDPPPPFTEGLAVTPVPTVEVWEDEPEDWRPGVYH
jgi:hypothetical protein